MRTGKHQRGFGYLLVLFAVAALGLLAASTGQAWHTAAQREREADLLFVGQQYRQALDSYYASSQGDAKQYPARLEDLLDDHRSQVTLRHLRKLYVDPMTGRMDWVLVMAGDRIIGLHSRSDQHSFKRVFEGPDAAFNGTDSYTQWVFRAGTSGAAP